MKKRILSLILTITILMSMLTIAPLSANAATSGIYTYTVTDGKATIRSCDSSASGDIVIPDALNGYPVTSICEYAFYCCYGLTSITIPGGVTSICEYAFCGCRSLTSITIPDSVTSIGRWAFYNCSSLTSISIPDSVTSIGEDAFYHCVSLTSIDVSKNNNYYSSVDGVLFNKQKTELVAYPAGKKETSYIIPEGVTSICEYAFSDCSSLTSITIPEGMTSIGDSAFSNCRSLISTTIPDSVTSIGRRAFYNCSSLTSITIPEGVISIGEGAFYYCSRLTSITIPEGVISIGEGAFYYCSRLTSITIPDSVISIGEGAFFVCRSLTSIDVSKDNNYYSSVDGVLFNKQKTELIAYPAGKKETSYIIPEGVTSICEYAFSDCDSLTSITIVEGVISIGEGAFSNCFRLTSITIPEDVTSIGDWVFSNCFSLTSIDVSKDNNYYSSVDGVLFNKQKTELVAYPAGKKETSYIIPEGVTSICEYAFSDCDSLTSITISEGVISIGEGAFYYCSRLTSITIPEGVISIGEDVFFDCRGLTSITIPDSVTSIGSSAFSNCISLKDVYFIGTEEKWNKISIRSYNEHLTDATIHYVSTEITSLTATVSDKTTEVTASIVYAPSNAKVYISAYDIEGNLLEIHKPILTDGIAKATFEAENVYRYKAYVWGNNIKALSRAKELYLDGEPLT